jgi:catechol 2,3-dioxygenase-like lactoylglutathione lyase family enzyme
MTAPRFDGFHHVKIPVTDIERSFDWYSSRLGFTEGIRFVEDGVLMGVTLEHPNGGPPLALRVDSRASDGIGGFDFFSVGVPDQESIDALAAHLSALGECHAGVHRATLGWILPMLHDPDGHEVRFYTTQHHSGFDGGTDIHNPRERAEALEQVQRDGD